jgi:uncharacterized OB-fold protein
MSGPRYRRTREQDQRLVAFECQECGWVSYPEKKRTCKKCATAPTTYERVQLQEHGKVLTFVEQVYLPDDFESPQLLGMIDIPQVGDGDPARVYGLFTDTEREEIEVGSRVDARFRELFADGDRPINSFKFSVPREEKA